jgi:hypothetical protein
MNRFDLHAAGRRRRAEIQAALRRPPSWKIRRARGGKSRDEDCDRRARAG